MCVQSTAAAEFCQEELKFKDLLKSNEAKKEQ
jgi:hypothetical protein